MGVIYEYESIRIYEFMNEGSIDFVQLRKARFVHS